MERIDARHPTNDAILPLRPAAWSDLRHSTQRA